MNERISEPVQGAGRITRYTHDGLTFDVRDAGPVDGDSVVLLHGFPERSSCWDAVAPLLHEQGLRTFAPDQRGYSPGARPRRRRDYRLSLAVADAIALLRRIDRPVHLVGHDWGAAVGWSVAARHPELVRSWTAVSVPHPLAFARALVSSDQALRSRYFGLFTVPLVPELLARPGGRLERGLRGSGMTEDDIARFRREMVADGALPGALGWYRAVWLSGAAPGPARVRVPTTLVWSDRDVAIGRKGVALTAGYVDAPYTLAVLEGVSHWIPTHEPERLAALVLHRIGSVGSVGEGDR